MGLLSKLFKNSNDEFNQEEYDRYNNSKIEEFAKNMIYLLLKELMLSLYKKL